MRRGARLAAAFLALALCAAPGPPGAHAAPEAPPGKSAPLLREEAVSAALAVPEDSLDAAALCARGEHLLEDGGRAGILRAREMFQAVVARHPEAACGHAGLARALASIVARAIEQDDELITRAVGAARAAVERGPDSPIAHAALAFALLADLHPDEAAAAAEAAVELGPQSHQAWHAASATRAAGGDGTGARQAAERAIALRPDLPALHHVMGNALLIEGRSEEAMDSYLAALVLCPDHLPSRFQLAVTFERLGEARQAATLLQQVIDRHPEDAGLAHLFMAHTLIGRGSPEAALTLLDRATFANSRGIGAGTVRYLQGVALELVGRKAEAVGAWQEVIERFPDATAGPAAPERLVDLATLGLARLKFAEGLVEEGVAILDRGAARPGVGPDLILRLARLYEEYRMPERAMPLMERACSSTLRPRIAEATLASCIAWARLARQRGDEAALARLARLLKDRTAGIERLEDVVHDLAAMRALAIAGQGAEALAWLERAMGRGYDRLAWIGEDPELEPMRRSPGYRALTTGASKGAAAPPPGGGTPDSTP